MALELFLGDAWLRRRAIARHKRTLYTGAEHSWREVRLDAEAFSLARCLEALRSPSLFDEGTLVHIAHIEKLPDDEAEALAKQLERALPQKRALILEGERLDKRKALYRTVAKRGSVHEFPPPGRRELPTLAKEILNERGIALSPGAFRYLLESVAGDLDRIGREAEKLALYLAHEPRKEGALDKDELRELLFHDRGGELFACLDAWLARRPEAPDLLKALLEGGEEPAKVFYLLAGQVRGLLGVKSLAEEGLSDEEISRKTGEFRWLVGKRRRMAEHLSTEELIGLIHRLHGEDVRIKRGEREPEEALWVLLLEWVFPALAADLASARETRIAPRL